MQVDIDRFSSMPSCLLATARSNFAVVRLSILLRFGKRQFLLEFLT
jgi:hypothetical protein